MNRNEELYGSVEGWLKVVI